MYLLSLSHREERKFIPLIDFHRLMKRSMRLHNSERLHCTYQWKPGLHVSCLLHPQREYLYVRSWLD
ncbi:hypothetical protein INR49_002552 [Caranx melampygus]|nr:hypothetical protein INR49_002552 [Caranx melampygus]